MLRSKLFYYLFGMYYCWIFLFANNEQNVLAQNIAIAFAMISYIVLLIQRKNVINKATGLVIITLLIFFLFRNQSNELNYSILNNYLYLIIIYCVYGLGDIRFIIKKNCDVIAIAMCVIILYFGFRYVIYGEDFLFGLLQEENYIAAFLFLLFLYCFKTKQNLCLVVSLLLIIIVPSRAYLLNIVIFLLFYYTTTFLKFFKKLHFTIDIKNYQACFYIINLIFFLIVFYIIYNFDEGESMLIDYSNYMRYLSDAFALDTLFNWKYLFSGLGYDIEDYIAYNWNFRSYATIQPHNSLLNMFMTLGILPGVFYYYVVFKTASLSPQNNLPYIITFIFYSLGMHSLLSSSFLLFWLFILYAEPANFDNAQTKSEPVSDISKYNLIFT